MNSRSVRVLPQAICTNDIGANSSQSMIFTVERQRTLNKREGWTGRVSVHTPDWRRFFVFFCFVSQLSQAWFFGEHFSSALFGSIFHWHFLIHFCQAHHFSTALFQAIGPRKIRIGQMPWILRFFPPYAWIDTTYRALHHTKDNSQLRTVNVYKDEGIWILLDEGCNSNCHGT